MATVSVTIPDKVLPRVLDAFATAYSYNPKTDGTKTVFAQGKVADYVAEVVKGHEVAVAAETARLAADAKVESEVVIT